MREVKEVESFVSGCSNTVSEVLNELDKFNIGLAKEKLYTLLKQSAQLTINIEKSKVVMSLETLRGLYNSAFDNCEIKSVVKKYNIDVTLTINNQDALYINTTEDELQEVYLAMAELLNFFDFSSYSEFSNYSQLADCVATYKS